jgi:hypothetical protein
MVRGVGDGSTAPSASTAVGARQRRIEKLPRSVTVEYDCCLSFYPSRWVRSLFLSGVGSNVHGKDQEVLGQDALVYRYRY